MPQFQQPERKPETPPAGPPLTPAELVGQVEPAKKLPAEGSAVKAPAVALPPEPQKTTAPPKGNFNPPPSHPGFKAKK